MYSVCILRLQKGCQYRLLLTERETIELVMILPYASSASVSTEFLAEKEEAQCSSWKVMVLILCWREYWYPILSDMQS